MAKQTKAEAPTAPNKYAARYAAIADNLARLDEIEARLHEVAAEQRAIGGRIPASDAAPRFAEAIRAMRERFEANLPSTRVFSEDGPALGRTFGRDPVDVLGLVLALIPGAEERADALVRRIECETGEPMAVRGARREALARERAALVREHGELTASVRAAGVERADLAENADAAAKLAADARAAERRAEIERQSRELLDKVIPADAIAG